MKTKLVLWGKDGKEERVLIALRLRAQDNKVDIWTFSEKLATEEFAKKMLNEWRNDTEEIEFPEGHSHQERELTVSEGLLPMDLKVERGDIVQRAQTEWHFIVLSSKLNDVYQAELAELKTKIEGMTAYDSQAWDSLKGFWSKVQEQVRERNLFREHANSLRDHTNALFTKLKSLRNALDEEFQALSKGHYTSFMTALETLEKKVNDGMNLSGAFEELKNMQRKFKETKLTKEHRSKIWEKLDGSFKKVKDLRFGPNANGDSSPSERLKRRYDGLLTAIEKMQRSINRDKDDLNFQNKRIASSDGQLESQIRQAKTKMIEERVRSKEEKLGEMNATKLELEQKMASQKLKDAKREEREKVEEAQKAAKQKIADKIKLAEEARKDEAGKLEKAAEAIKPKAKVVPVVKTEAKDEAKTEVKSETKDDTIVGAVSNTLGEVLEDAIDTVKAVANVIGDKIEEKVEDAKEAIQEIKQDIDSEDAVGSSEEE